jgi:hypothetical protein
MNNFVDLVDRLRAYGRVHLADKLSAFFAAHHAHRGVSISESSAEFYTYRFHCEQCDAHESFVEDPSLRKP